MKGKYFSDSYLIKQIQKVLQQYPLKYPFKKEGVIYIVGLSQSHTFNEFCDTKQGFNLWLYFIKMFAG